MWPLASVAELGTCRVRRGPACRGRDGVGRGCVFLSPPCVPGFGVGFIAVVRERRRAAVARTGTRHTGDGTSGGVECGVVDRRRGELRSAAVGSVGGRRRAVLGVEGRRGVGGGRGHQRRRRAGEAEELGSGGRRRGGKVDRGGKCRSPLQQIVIWRVKFFGGSSKHTFIG
jgi:hypothetical protein